MPSSHVCLRARPRPQVVPDASCTASRGDLVPEAASTEQMGWEPGASTEGGGSLPPNTQDRDCDWSQPALPGHGQPSPAQI